MGLGIWAMRGHYVDLLTQLSSQGPETPRLAAPRLHMQHIQKDAGKHDFVNPVHLGPWDQHVGPLRCCVASGAPEDVWL